MIRGTPPRCAANRTSRFSWTHPRNSEHDRHRRASSVRRSRGGALSRRARDGVSSRSSTIRCRSRASRSRSVLHFLRVIRLFTFSFSSLSFSSPSVPGLSVSVLSTSGLPESARCSDIWAPGIRALDIWALHRALVIGWTRHQRERQRAEQGYRCDLGGPCASHGSRRPCPGTSSSSAHGSIP